MQSCSMTKIVQPCPKLQSNKLSGIPESNAFDDSVHYGICHKMKQILLKDDPAISVLTLDNY